MTTAPGLVSEPAPSLFPPRGELEAQQEKAKPAVLRCDSLTRAFNMRLEQVSRVSRAVVDPSLPLWSSATLGDSVCLQEGGTSVSRLAEAGWGHALLDRWLRHGVTSVMLQVEEGHDMFVGVVGSNFLPSASEWDAPLSDSRHAVVVHTRTGKVFHKGAPSLLALPLPMDQAKVLRRQFPKEAHKAAPRCVVRRGSIVRLIIDMVNHELTLELLSSPEETADVQSSVVIDGLPLEVGVAVSLGAGKQRVRIMGLTGVNDDFRPRIPPKMLSDLWDDDHVIKPLRISRSRQSRELADRLQHSLELIKTAQECNI
ncbi:hypothetical protein AB1Y20_013941 [Prymnesium parvum]|uniref:Uncharacterized protein n=1 Tax=Prymnesium parvum TaxID=97485 RepID=A0AB34IHS9_PRYPA